MTALTVSAALAIALQCAPSLDAHMLVGIAQHESGLEAQILHDNDSGIVVQGAEVLRRATALIRAGHSVDLGPWQINSRNLDLLGLSIDDALDPCRAAAGAAKLIKLLSYYNTGSDTRGVMNGYAGAVLRSIRGVKAAHAPQPIAGTPSCPEPDPTGWHITATSPGCESSDPDWHFAQEKP